METIQNFEINFGDYHTSVSRNLFWRLRDWAIENKVKFRLTESSYYEDKSYEEQVLDEFGGDAKPTCCNYGIIFSAEFPDIFFANINSFYWTKK